MKWVQDLVLNQWLLNCKNEWKDYTILYILLPQNPDWISTPSAALLGSTPAPSPAPADPSELPAKGYKEFGFNLGGNRAEQQLF